MRESAKIDRAMVQWEAYGFFSTDSGLAQAARMNVGAFVGAGREVRTHDLNPGAERAGRHPFESPVSTFSSEGPRAQLYLFNPTDLEWSLAREYPKALKENAFRVIVPFWELTKIPANWREVLGQMDAILAPTRFIEETLRSADLGDIPVFHFPAVREPEPIASGDRARWCLPSEGFLFLSSFDVSSDPARKNPEAAIAAFLEAFPEGDGRAHLVIKAHNARLLPEAQERMAQLERLVAQHDHLHLFTERIAHDDLPAFHASFDALISLHRSEGLGLILMEMMAQGKPVVATNWSGNLDFCTSDNSVLIDFDFVPVKAVHPLYQPTIAQHPDLQWAEPRIDEAAAALRQLVENPAWAAHLGAQARKDMLDRVNLDCSPVISALESLVANSPGNSAEQSQFFQEILTRATPRLSLSERWVKLKRRLGIRGALIRKR